MKRSDYITVLSPMVTDLKLSGNALIIFALIHGFTKDGEHFFNGSIDYICQWTNLSKASVISNLKTLTEKGFINKYERYDKGVKFCYYNTNYDNLTTGKETLPGVKKVYGGSKETLPVGSKETLHNIDILDNNIDIDSIYAAADKNRSADTQKERKTLFSNSGLTDLVNGDDYSKFEELFKDPGLENVDIAYYYNVVKDWSDQKDMKRTRRGWIATVRTFIRKDAEANKLHLKYEAQPQNEQQMLLEMDRKYREEDNERLRAMGLIF